MNQQFIQSLSIDWNKIEDDSYLREIEAINKLKEVVFEKPITFFVGENGSGKKMKYMGSKSRIKKHIVPIIQELIDKNEIKTYIEPFVGGANVIDSIVCENRIGGDLHDKLIALFEHVQSGGELPLEVPKQLYDDVRLNKNTCKYEDWFVGAVGFLASYNGRYFDGGYAKTIVSKTGATRNYYDEAKRNLEQHSI